MVTEFNKFYTILLISKLRKGRKDEIGVRFPIEGLRVQSIPPLKLHKKNSIHNVMCVRYVGVKNAAISYRAFDLEDARRWSKMLAYTF